MTWKEFNQKYRYSVRRWPDVAAMNTYWNTATIETTITKQEKRYSTRWHTEEVVSCTYGAVQYMNTIDAVPFFKELGGKEMVSTNTTKYGKIPVRIVSLSPDRTERTIREFKFN